MTVTVFCPHCNQWKTKPGDRYCSQCGAPLYETRVVYLSHNDPSAAYGSLIIQNNSDDRAVTYKLIPCDKWIELDKDEIVIEPHRRAEVGFKVIPREMGGLAKGSCFVQVFVEGVLVKEIQVQAFPAPKEITVKDLKVYEGATNATIIIRSECPLTVDELRFEVTPPIALLEFESTQLSLNEGETPVPVKVTVKQIGVADVSAQLRRRSGEDKLHFTASFKLEVKRPPTIDIGGSQFFYVNAKPEEVQTVTIPINNLGADDLKIDAILLNPSSRTISWDFDFEPTKVPPNGTYDFKLTLTTEPNAQGEVNSQLSFRSNDPKNPEFTVVVSIQEEPYQDFLAIDYGTSASTIALCTSGEPRNLVLEDNTTMKSDVFIQELRSGNNPPFSWVTGKQAWALRNTASDRFIRSAKVKVGTGYQYRVMLQGERRPIPAEQVAQMVVMDLIRLARRKIGARPTRIIFTVPTRFTLHQQEVFEEVFNNAAKAKGLTCNFFNKTYIDESLAAGMYYLLCRVKDEPEIGKQDNHKLLVMDFGGGTVDVTLFDVHCVQNPNTGIYQPNEAEVIGSWGNENLGGDRLTEEFGEWLKSNYPELPPELKHLATDELQLAEQVKIKLSNLSRLLYPKWAPIPPASDPQVLDALRTFGYEDSEISSLITRSEDIKVPKRDTNSISLGPAVNFWKTWYSEFQGEMRFFMSRAGVKKADMLLLCGQASILPVIPEMFSEFASQTKYVTDHKGNLILKECVSLGALIHAVLGSDRIKLKGLNRIWHRLGIPRRGSSGEPIAFNPIVEWGSFWDTEYSFPIDATNIAYQEENNCTVVEFVLRENLTLGERLNDKAFKTYRLVYNGRPVEEHKGILKLTDKGEIRVFCVKGGLTQEMKPVS